MNKIALLKRLVKQSNSPPLHSTLFILELIVCRDKNHGHTGVRFPQFSLQVETAHPRHANVVNQQIKGRCETRRQEVLGRCEGPKIES